jgi:hypothetical protein
MVNGPDIIVKKRKAKTCILTDHNSSGQKCHPRGSREEIKILEFMPRDATNVELEM